MRKIVCRLVLLLFAIGVAPVSSGEAAGQAGDQSGDATAKEIESLDLQAKQLDELVAARLGRGEPVSDEIGQELTEIFGELARFREVQRRHQAAGNEGTGVSKADAAALADRIAALRVQLRWEQPAPTEEAPSGIREAETGRESERPEAAPGPISIPENTRAIIRLKAWLSSKDAEVGDRFEATAVQSVRVDGRLAIPEGALFEGYVAEVEKARRASRGGKLLLVVDRLHGSEGQTAAVRATVVDAAYGEDLEGDDVDTGKVITRGVLGAIVGGLIGGGKGALIGLGIGSGGTLLADKGEDVDLPAGTQLRVRFETSVSVTWGWAPEK